MFVYVHRHIYTSHICTSNWSPSKQRCLFCMLRVLATIDYRGLRWWLHLLSIWELRPLHPSLWNGLCNFSLSERLLILTFKLAEQFSPIIPLHSELHRLILHYVKITFLWFKHCRNHVLWNKVNRIISYHSHYFIYLYLISSYYSPFLSLLNHMPHVECILKVL